MNHSNSSKHLILLLAIIAIWLTTFPYAGIVHDARLYTLQAAAHLQPDLYGRDISLLYGSQDRFTVFTPLYAKLSSWIGIEHAAAFLTFAGAVAVLAAVWLLTTAHYSGELASLTTGLAAILPGHYGSKLVFSYLEPFVTPRPFAEALVLISIVGYFSGRSILCWISLAAAFAIHPIMAMAGFIFIVTSMAIRDRRFAANASLACLPIGATCLLLTPTTFARFDYEWLDPVSLRNPYLFLTNWSSADWARTLVPFATLVAAILLLHDSTQRRIAVAALLTGIFSLALTLVGCDWLKLVLVTQGQPWRWLWLTTLVALLFCPYLFQQLWHQSKPARPILLVLTAAWLIRNEPSSLGLALLAVLGATTAKLGRLSEQTWRRLIWCSWFLLAAIIAWIIAINALPSGWVYGSPDAPAWLNQLRDLCRSGLLPLTCLLLTFALSLHTRVRMPNLLQGLTWTAACVSLVTASGAAWTKSTFGQPVFESFAPWREKIPVGQDVLWPDDPVAAWLLLQRPSYLSSVQTTTTLFSRRTAIESNHRAQKLDAYLKGKSFMDWDHLATLSTLNKITLSEICTSEDIRFVVTKRQLESTPALELQGPALGAYAGVRLYSCPQSTRTTERTLGTQLLARRSEIARSNEATSAPTRLD